MMGDMPEGLTEEEQATYAALCVLLKHAAECWFDRSIPRRLVASIEDPAIAAGYVCYLDTIAALREQLAERDKEVERLKLIEEDWNEDCEQCRRVMDEPEHLGFPDERHCTCVPILKRALTARKEEAERLKGALHDGRERVQAAFDIAHEAPELNMANLTTEEIGRLNDAMNEVHGELDDALGLLKPAESGKENPCEDS